MEVKRTFDLLDYYAGNYMKDIALSMKRDGNWLSWSTQEYINICYEFGYGLLEFGLKKGDKLLSISNNRPEWNFIDHGMSMAGLIHVPVYASLTEEEYRYILEHSEAKMIIVSDKRLYNVLASASKGLAAEKALFLFEKMEGFRDWNELLELGKNAKEKRKDELERIKESISEKDISSLLYTSGTTGRPKGVMLSHENFVKNFKAAIDVFNLTEEDKYLSILPLCHVGGRMGNYQSQYSGASIYYPESMGTFARAMQEINGDGFDAVPRVLEKVYDNIIAKGKQLDRIKKRMFFWAVKLGKKYDVNGKPGWFYRKKLSVADKLIFSKWREALGGRVRLVGCGGSALQESLERLFWAAGVKVMNMYGLTETSPVITINSTGEGNFRLGSVGKLIDGVELKIADDGEIMCKGHNVMMGYYKDEDLTKAAFTDDGWFKTGDIGHVDKDGFLYVTDRKKEIFKLSNGKFIAPQLLEGVFKQSAFIDQMMVVGEHQKFASALIVPDFEAIRNWCKESGIAIGKDDILTEKPEVMDHIQKEVNLFNKRVNAHERLQRVKLISDNWSPESGELSATLKLKRSVVNERYKTLIEEIYL
jgi:long-chain acyl-CoA synthetase